ncbi:MAG: HAD-IIB family hydrolase [Planctomycetaceae bacterium]|nr:HAD-IIB family hydrolase [Planctomycetaceae bacterium]
MKKTENLKITLISLHGLIRANNPELGRDADTGGQIKYLLELAKELAAHSHVREVELLTRQIIDPRISDDYAQLEEPIAENARIVRIPFGPKRYIRKESLWPYLELFVDQTLQHFRRTGLPDIIHGHYADAGKAGAQLASLLHIPYVFTSHSLGRVKRERLSVGDHVDTDKLERKYHFRTRIEAEEFALETASMVVTSTNQEVEQQYQMYDHYQPERMEVIPPGVDLTSFMPVDKKWKTPTYAEQLNCFLQDPDKPMILAMARPDERKNLETLVTVYGESEQLQEAANLVVVMGSRDDFRDMPKGQRMVIKNVLHLIDKYNLYGKVAYPKSHNSDDVPELYRLAASKQGVFINPALTEPFGLTLLEAGATGLPIVATNDGGPRDIIANCQNGLLVDPLNHADIEHALLRALTDKEQWETWSKNGIQGTREYYCWSNHANRYLRDLDDILEHSPPPVLKNVSTKRRLPEFDRLIITDLDNTLTGDDESLHQFIQMLKENDHIGFGIATGRRLDSALELIQELGLPQPDLIDTDCGTKLHYGENLTVDSSWRKSIGYAWNPEEIRKTLAELPGLKLQPDEHQSEYKISYELDTRVCPTITTIKKTLREAGLRAKVVSSLGMYLDVIPVRGGSDLSLRHVLWKWGFSPERVLVSGDSGNDAGMLLGRTLGVVVGNHSRELKRLRNRPRIYFAEASHAAGILEGIQYYHFLDNIVIPNDRNE